jgi:DNA polymerase
VWAADITERWEAHNAQFEKAIWRNIMMPSFGLPDIPDNRWDDTLASCAYHAIPLKLERALAVLGLPFQKDTEGSRLTVSLSKPRKDGTYDRSAPTLARVVTYCASDVDAEVALSASVGKLSKEERAVWLLDQRINQRGVRLDTTFIRAAQRIVEDASAPLAKRFEEISGFRVTQIQAIKGWLADRGIATASLDAEHVEELLDGERPLPLDIDEALRIRSLIGSAAVKKLPRMLACVCADGRARGMVQYHGATTGRWAARLWQPHNIPRGTTKLDGSAPDPDLMVDAILTGDYRYVEALLGPAVEVVVSSLRHAIVPSPGKLLGVGDYAGVEARLVLALSGQHDKCDLMASGADVYSDMASAIYRQPINKKDNPEERLIGKNTVLGCGFQMGADKFHRRYASHMTFEFCQGVIQSYRKVWAPKVPELWYGLERAAARTVHYKTPHEAYGVTFRLVDRWLTARLPSGQVLWYYDPQPTFTAPPWDPDEKRLSWSFKALKMGQWRTIDAYGGLLTENVIQALARGLLVRAMFICERENLPVILTVHDEIITEGERDNVVKLQQIMEDRPQWAIDIKAPIQVEAWVGERYKKG